MAYGEIKAVGPFMRLNTLEFNCFKIVAILWAKSHEPSTEEVMRILDCSDKETGGKAYTTVKTILDRLVTKKYLSRRKYGAKFRYQSLQTLEQVKEAILKRIQEIIDKDFEIIG